jgi:hypothetical protein
VKLLLSVGDRLLEPHRHSQHDIMVVAKFMGHQRLETSRTYTVPTAEDRERAINSISGRDQAI